MTLESRLESVDTCMNFREWFNLDEMSARRSFAHTMGKFRNEADRPTATLTAFRTYLDLEVNQEANKKMVRQFKKFGLSYYPIIGAGQEIEDGVETVADEESFVVSPIDPDMSNEEFTEIIKQLLFDPTGEDNIKFAQDSAAMKLPGVKKAFLLAHDRAPEQPTSPNDYKPGFELGKSARPRRGQDTINQQGDEEPMDRYYTQMTKGPEASNSMKNTDELEKGSKPGRRFTISKGRF
jgi:hypothetical protein